MKQFILATSLVNEIPAGGSVTTEGQLNIINKPGSDFFQLVVGRGESVMPDSYVVYKKNLRWSKTEYSAGSQFEATVKVEVEAGKYNETHVVISKLGAVFNQRNVWTSSGHGKNATEVALCLADNINKATNTHGLVASANANVVTLKTLKGDYTDYSIAAENTSIDLMTNAYNVREAKVTVVNKGVTPVADGAYVKELAHKCMGDKGVGYSYVEAYLDTYHFYNNVEVEQDAKFAIYNLAFYNPRYDHNIDEPLYQKLHIAVPEAVAAALLEDAIADKDAKNEVENSVEE